MKISNSFKVSLLIQKRLDTVGQGMLKKVISAPVSHFYKFEARNLLELISAVGV